MAGVADKIKQTQDSFPAQKPGAVAECPYKTPVSKAPAPQADVATAFALTRDMVRTFGTPQKVEEKKEKKAWIEIVLVDMEGKPVPGVRYRITTPDGEVQEGNLNEHGQAGYYQIEPGTCKVTFPDLDKDAWE